MRNVFVALLAVGLCVSVAMADATATADFDITRGVAIFGHSSETFLSGGARSQAKSAQYQNHSLLMDFDFDAMSAFVAANIEAGFTAKYELRVNSSNGATNGSGTVNVALVAAQMRDAGMDWVEGDGLGSGPFDWTPGTQAALRIDPDTFQDATTGPSMWKHSSGDLFASRNNLAIRNASLLSISAAGEYWVELDQAFVDLQSAADMQGFYTYDADSVGDNVQLYTDDQNSASWPLIRVSFVPEPASMSLLIIGGVAALIRRKK
jgi:hypothetical protein